MNTVPRFVVLGLLSALSLSGPVPERLAAAEPAAKAPWVETLFGSAKGADAPPFSFTYGGKPSAEVLKKWDRKHEDKKLDDKRTEHTYTYTDPAAGLVVRCVAVEYHDYPTIEWTLYFKNTGTKDTPRLEDVQALDTRLERQGDGEFVLHHHLGSPARVEDYQPFQTVLKPKEEKRFTASGGRASNSELPYFNVEGPGEGVIVVVGWPGQWAARFTRDEGPGLQIRAGQELTKFKLHPGEEVRSPLIALQLWKGDRLDGQNVWRRWMLAHNLPRPGGKLPAPQLAACSSHQFGEMIGANEANQKEFIDRYLEEKLLLDYWWMDAGWYVNKGEWVNTGTWEVDRKRFPRGLKAITDHAHAKGLKCIVWFEPERVTPGTWLSDNHPEWLLKPPFNPGTQAYDPSWRLLDLGNPDARKWLTDHVDRLITEQGIDLYRQDFNIDPLFFWRAHDPEDRQGITEIKYLTGYLAYWDELRRRHPKMLIDSCASGGRRNDLETMRRAVPLTRSDYLFEPTGEQCHTYGIASWIPYYGTGTLVGPSKIANIPSGQVDAYVFRSNMCPSLTACWDVRRKDLDYGQLRHLTDQWRQVAPNFLGDYYPLTPYSTANDAWMAWQFDRPKAGRGVVQAFRRGDSPKGSALLRLRGLKPNARYTVSDLDEGGLEGKTGRSLMDEGLIVTIKDRPGAAIVVYKEARE
jgi:alpha-galactosidase